MKRSVSIVAALLISAVGSSCAQKTTSSPTRPKTAVRSYELSPEMRKLEIYVGEWVYEGEQVDPPVAGLPYGSAGKFSGTFTARFVLGGRFLEEKIVDKNPSGTNTNLAMNGYDAKAKNYFRNLYISDGSRDTSVRTVSPDGRTWTSHSTMITSMGENVPIRTVIKFSPDGNRFEATGEVSPDNGNTWKHWFKDEAKKISK